MSKVVITQLYCTGAGVGRGGVEWAQDPPVER